MCTKNKMERPSCPNNYTLIQNLCYSNCPQYTAPANEDPSRCVPEETCASTVSNLWSSGQIPLENDTVFSMVCNKISFTMPSGGCPTGYTEWRDAQCFVNCPPGMIENGLTCLRKPLARQFTSPTCSNAFLHFNGSECAVSMYAALLFFTVIAVFLIYVLKPYAPESSFYFNPLNKQRR